MLSDLPFTAKLSQVCGNQGKNRHLHQPQGLASGTCQIVDAEERARTYAEVRARAEISILRSSPFSLRLFKPPKGPSAMREIERSAIVSHVNWKVKNNDDWLMCSPLQPPINSPSIQIAGTEVRPVNDNIGNITVPMSKGETDRIVCEHGCCATKHTS